MSISRGKENFRQLQNQYLDSLTQIDRDINSSVGNLTQEKLKRLNQEFQDAYNLIKEMELEALSTGSNMTQTKKEIQMHQIDLRDLKQRYGQMIKTNQKYASTQMQGLEQYVIDIEELNTNEDFGTDQNFFKGNLKLIEGKKDILFVEQLANQMQKNIHEQNQKLDKMNQNQQVINFDIQDSNKNINKLQAKKYLTKYFVYLVLAILTILFVYIISDKIIYFFS